MTHQTFRYRIIKVGKTTVSVALCGLAALATTGASAQFSQNVGSNPSPIVTSSTSWVDIYFQGASDGFWASQSYSGGNITITLESGVNVTGQVPVGSTSPVAISTRDYPDWDNNNPAYTNTVSFTANTTTLNLQGENSITGAVGVHGSQTGSGFVYGPFTQADPIDRINVNGTNVSFNGRVFADVISINQGGTLKFYDDVSSATGLNGSIANTTINYNGNDATVTLNDGVTVTGSIVKTSTGTGGGTNGTLIFTGTGTVTGSVGGNSLATGTMGLVQVQGAGDFVRINGNLSTDRLNYMASSVVGVGGDLILNINNASDAVNAVTLRNTDGTLQVDGNIVGVAGKVAINNTADGTGTVTMLGGTQTITGGIGQSGFAIRQLNIGGAYQTGTAVGLDNSDSAYSLTNITGNVYAKTISLNSNDGTAGQDSALTMNSGSSIQGNVVTEIDQRGILTMAGGTQTVDGTVGGTTLRLAQVNSGATSGNTTFTGTVDAVTVSNLGSGTSTFQADVTATTINVGTGTSNFQTSVSAANTNIGTGGTGNFNTVSGTTSSAINFTGAGTANLYQGLTGNINFAGNAGVVNVWAGETLDGNVTNTTTNNRGTINFKGAGAITGTVGSAAANGGIAALNINSANEQTTGTQVLASGSIYADKINLLNAGTLAMASGANITGTGTNPVVTTASNNTGTLRFMGNSTVTGQVGASGAALGSVEVGSAGATGTKVVFNNTVYTQALNYATSSTTVQLNGTSPLVGSINFKPVSSITASTLELGNDVNLNTADTTFQNAGDATLKFLANGTVTGNLGNAANTNSQNFAHIYAGADGKTVTFGGNVYTSANSLYVSGDGTVNLQGDLNGTLKYDVGSSGTVNVASGKNIYGAVTTLNPNNGTLNFAGSTTTQAPIGDASAKLAAVNFHSVTSDPTAVPLATTPTTVNIGHNIYALQTGIGNSTTATTANVTATGLYLGDALTLSSNTTLNTASPVTTATQAAVDAGTAASRVNFGYTVNNNGTLSTTTAPTQSTTGTGAITANDATLNFAVGTQNWDATNGGGLISTSGSSKITGDTNSTLTLGANSKVNLALLGSMRNGQTVTLIDTSPAAGSTTYAASAATVLDNSYVMSTALTQGNNDGDLVLQVTRTANAYVVKSGTTGHFSNPAALQLGTLAYYGKNSGVGINYSQDIQTVLNKLDIDQWGYGNNQANLAVQAKRLAPIANNSLAMTAFDAASMGTDSIGVRIHELRSRDVPSPYATTNLWIKNNMMSGTQSARGDYDGYTQRIGGLTGGIDSHPNKSSLVGVAVSYSNSKVRQQDFHIGDEASIEMTQGSLYGAYDITEDLFVDGILSIAKQQTKGIRTTVVGRTASYDVNGTQTGYKFSLGHRFGISDTNMTLTPLLSYESRNLKQDAYQETGAGDIGLSMAQQSLRRNQTGVGIRWASTEYMGGIVVKPEATLTRLNYSGNYDKAIQASFIGDLSTNAVFQTQPVEGTAGATKLSLGAGLLLNKTSSMMVRYDHFRRDAYRHNALELLVRWDF